ncbi:MAG TPA: hypothetical protein VKA27_11500 [Sunxiuqinia sp.]|nr:hypothetical protein [Sunxiuqinia sp.]
MKIIRLGILLVGFGIMVSSCSKSGSGSGSLYQPTSADVTPNATLAQLQQGRALYTSNCNACHYLYSPSDFSASTWPSIVAQMAPNTNMSSSEVKLVLKYLTKGK